MTGQPTDIPDGYKRCRKGVDCVHPNGPLLPATEEYFQWDKRGYFQANCRECERARLKQYAVDHPDQMKANSERYRQNRPDLVSARNKRYREAHPERVKENSRKIAMHYYYRHHDKVLALAREYGKKNRDQIRAYERKRRQQNPIPGRLKGHKRRARLRELPSTFESHDWQRAVDYFGGCCAVCGRPAGLWHTLSPDHWIPLASPDCPGNVPENIVPMCNALADGTDGCNNSKNSQDPHEWLVWKFGKRKANQILKRIHAYFDWLQQGGD